MEIGKSRALRAEWFLPRWVENLWPIRKPFVTDRDLINAVETYVSRPPDWPWFSGLDGLVTISTESGSILRILGEGRPFTGGQIIFDNSRTRARINFQGNWYDLSEDNPDNGPDPWWENR